MRALFLGGDLRQKYACDFLLENNIFSEYYSEFSLDDNMKKIIQSAQVLALPVPISNNDMNLNFTNT